MPTSDDTRKLAPVAELVPSRGGARPSAMPFTGVLLSIYVVAVVLFSAYPGLSTIATGLGLVLAFVFAIEVIRRRQRLYFPAPVITSALFVCFCIFQMVWSPGSITALLTLIQLFIMFFIVINYCLSVKYDIYIEIAVYFAVICTFIYLVLFNPEVISGRVSATVGNANQYAFVLLLGVLLILRRLLVGIVTNSGSLSSLMFALLYLLLSVYGIIYLSGSRMGIVLTIASIALVCFYWIWLQPLRRRFWLMVVVSAAFCSLGYVVYESPQFSRLVPMVDYFQGQSVEDTSIIARDQMRKDGIDLWLARPFTGWGLDQYRVVSGWRTYAHDNYAELLTNGGLFGLLLYIVIYLAVFVQLMGRIRLRRYPGAAAGAFWGVTVVIVMLAADFSTVSYYNKFHWLMLGVVAASAGGHSSLQRVYFRHGNPAGNDARVHEESGLWTDRSVSRGSGGRTSEKRNAFGLR